MREWVEELRPDFLIVWVASVKTATLLIGVNSPSPVGSPGYDSYKLPHFNHVKRKENQT